MWVGKKLCVCARACVCGLLLYVQYHGPLPSLPPKILYSGMGKSKPAKQILAWEENFP